MPKVSVIMSTFNDADYLPAAINSVLGQTFGDFELLITDDASTDATAEVLKKYQIRDNRITSWRNNNQLGLTANLNVMLAKVQGEFIARLDSDDEWIDSNKLKQQVEFLQNHPACALVGAWAEVVTDDGKKLYNFQPPAQDQSIKNQILWRNCFVHSSILARKQNITQAGGYDIKQTYIEDYALWLKLGLAGELANLPQVMVRYRVNQKGVTQSKNLEQIKGALALIGAYKKRYPGFVKAKVKWLFQYLFTAVFGTQNLVRLK